MCSCSPLALTTGWLVPAPRLAMAAFLGPWLVALIYQTADIGLGYAVSQAVPDCSG